MGKLTKSTTRTCPDCGGEQVQLTSQTAANPGRKFWKCPGCSFVGNGKSSWKGWNSDEAAKSLLGIELTPVTMEKLIDSVRKTGRSQRMTRENMENLSGGWVEKWKVASLPSGKVSIVALHLDGFYGCSCPAWASQGESPNKREPCKHILQHLATPLKEEPAEPTKKEWVWF